VSHSKMASTSTAATTNSNYHIFLNHRGHVKGTFGSHLYRRLQYLGYRVFLDKDELKVGENSDLQIKTVIATVIVNIAIFSPGYAESPWCLNELNQMFESEATIIPVFLNVKPAELRSTGGEEGWFYQVLRFLRGWPRGEDGVYAKALCNLKRKRSYDAETHRKKPKYEPSTIEKWRDSLKRASDLTGLELAACNGDEGELIDKIERRVEQIVRKTSFPNPIYCTGLDELREEFERTILQEQQPPCEAKVVLIVGPAGIGKTALAEAFVNHHKSEYNGWSLLPDVREASLIDLQTNLVKDLVSEDPKIVNIADGRRKLSRYLHRYKALIVLDDVDNVEQLDALFSPAKAALSSDSLILVTTCNKNILSGLKESSIYEVKTLDENQSQELFCRHAFDQPYPVSGFEKMVGAFLYECTGLPLYLKVFGALLSGKDLNYWEDQFCKISTVLPIHIQSRLKISFDSLDLPEKQMFLHIAIFFFGKDRDRAITTWEGLGWEGSLGFVTLKNKCLIDVDDKNRLRMHRCLRDLGRYLAERPGWRPCLRLPPGSFS